jgi:large subunit ribosomal protein L24
MKLHIKKNDKVKIITGDDKGKEGKVLKVFPKEGRAIIEGLNIVKKHKKPTAQNTNGTIVEQEAPIHISNLMLVDGKGNATRTGRKMGEDNKLVRYSKKSGEVIK